MIVKNGRLYLWQNNISEQELVVKVGTGLDSSEYVEIDQTDLVEEVTDASVLITSEAGYAQWQLDNSETNWDYSIADISINSTIQGTTFYDITEGLFYSFDTSWTLITGTSYTSTSGTSAASGGSDGEYYFKTDTLALYLKTDGEWEEVIPNGGDMLYDSTEESVYIFSTSWALFTNPLWLGTSGTAVASDGVDGDYYFKNDTLTLYIKIAGVWEVLHKYLFTNERKIIMYVMISTTVAFELGEIGLFVVGTPDVMISRNLINKQYISTSESKIIKYTINI